MSSIDDGNQTVKWEQRVAAIINYQNQMRDRALELLEEAFTIASEQLGEDYAIEYLKERLQDIYEQRVPPAPPKPKLRTPIEPSLRRQILERDAYRCQECGGWTNLSLDHIIPITKGGQNTADNLRVLCLSCNTRKGNRT